MIKNMNSYLAQMLECFPRVKGKWHIVCLLSVINYWLIDRTQPA